MMIGYFEYKGINSFDIGLAIDANLTLSSPSADVEFVKIPGKDGELAISDGTLKNLSFDFPTIVVSKEPIEIVKTNLSNWLKSDVGWRDLTFSGDPDYIYKAMYHEEFDVERNIEDYGKCLLSFTIKPYKYLKSGLSEIALESSITNPTTRKSKPLIKITGEGNIKLTIGGSVLTLKDVDKGIIIDCESETVKSFDGKNPQFNKMTSYPFLKISPGKQTTSVVGNVKEIKIIPRWEGIV